MGRIFSVSFFDYGKNSMHEKEKFEVQGTTATVHTVCTHVLSSVKRKRGDTQYECFSTIATQGVIAFYTNLQ